MDKYNDGVSATKKGTATAADVLAGKTFTNSSSVNASGSMVNNGAKTASLNCGEAYTIPAGYHNGSGKITANSLASQTDGTATAADIMSGKTAYVDGVKITGTKTLTTYSGATSVTPSNSTQTLSTSGKYVNSDITIAPALAPKRVSTLYTLNEKSVVYRPMFLHRIPSPARLYQNDSSMAFSDGESQTYGAGNEAITFTLSSKKFTVSWNGVETTVIASSTSAASGLSSTDFCVYMLYIKKISPKRWFFIYCWDTNSVAGISITYARTFTCNADGTVKLSSGVSLYTAYNDYLWADGTASYEKEMYIAPLTFGKEHNEFGIVRDAWNYDSEGYVSTRTLTYNDIYINSAGTITLNSGAWVSMSGTINWKSDYGYCDVTPSLYGGFEYTYQTTSANETHKNIRRIGGKMLTNIINTTNCLYNLGSSYDEYGIIGKLNDGNLLCADADSANYPIIVRYDVVNNTYNLISKLSITCDLRRAILLQSNILLVIGSTIAAYQILQTGVDTYSIYNIGTFSKDSSCTNNASILGSGIYSDPFYGIGEGKLS